MDLFSVAATLTLETGEFDSSLKKAQDALNGLVNGSYVPASGTKTNNTLLSVARTADRVASSIWNVGSKAMGFGWGLIQTASAVKANQDAFYDTLGESAGDALAIFQEIGKEANLLPRTLLEQGTLGFTQFKTAGMEQADALASMEKALRLAADAAARYDISLEDASYRVLSFIRGNVEGGIQIGLMTSQTDRANKALELYGDKWANLTSDQRQNVMLHIAQDMYDAANTTGQAMREAGQFGVAYSKFSETWKGARALMGDALSEKMIPVLEKLTETMQQNPDLFIAIGETMGELFEVGSSVLLETLKYVVDHKDDIVNMVKAVGDMLSGNFWGHAEEPSMFERAMAYATGADVSLDKVAKAFGSYEKAAGFARAVNAWMENNPDKARAEIPVEAVASWMPEAEEKLQGQASTWQILVQAIPTTVKTIDSILSTWGGDDANPHDMGLPYVPFDGYPAILHRGESVLSRVEAEDWRSATRRNTDPGPNTGITRDELLSTLRNMSISMDGRTVGALVTPYVSREQAAEAWRRR